MEFRKAVNISHGDKFMKKVVLHKGLDSAERPEVSHIAAEPVIWYLGL